MEVLWKRNNKASLINIPNATVNFVVQFLVVIIRIVTIVVNFPSIWKIILEWENDSREKIFMTRNFCEIFSFTIQTFLNGMPPLSQDNKLSQKINFKISKHKSPLSALEIINLFP